MLICDCLSLFLPASFLLFNDGPSELVDSNTISNLVRAGDNPSGLYLGHSLLGEDTMLRFEAE